ncbi:hypothetical protein HMN09_00174100 [Mycena chlorophos]|uniref:Yeast cell wall synthesis Kre9/Knh1-like N-terminal domain-containing protein n=1 Tax=Mycena chlorophos TaxID=658473 RepID=A0A8H6TSD2_MYCCL|nr:hypothetical protein HMN09_00174100 [Mycena chlorophos]
MLALSSALIALALAKTSFAALAFTSPTGSSVFTAGQSATVTWEDDQNAPALSTYGNCMLSIYAGNADQQTNLYNISTGLNPANPLTISFNVPASIGPNSGQYFIRLQSLTAMDPTDATLPLLAFSHQFNVRTHRAMTGMTGAFDAQVLSEIAGQATAPIGGSAAASTPTPTTSAAAKAPATSSAKANVASASGSKTSAAPKASGSSAASPRMIGSTVGLLSGVAAVLGALL